MMSESTTNSMESGGDSDNVPLMGLLEVPPGSVPDLRSIEAVDTVEGPSDKYLVKLETNLSTAQDLDYDCDTNTMSTQSYNDDEDDDDSEMEVKPLDEVPIDIPQQDPDHVKPKQESWPTLEILPGGVIKPSEKDEEYPASIYEECEKDEDKGDLMYACAKCPERFQMLYDLVKHVRWHDDEKKREEGHLSKLSPFEKDLIRLKRDRVKLEKKYKQQKLELSNRLVAALSHFDLDILNI